MPGRCLEGVRRVSGWYLEGSRRCLKVIWKVSGMYMEGALNVSGRCLKGVWKVLEHQK